MQKLDLKPYYDIVVIGAGIGGLTSAALLSKAGYSVCVLEKEPHAGGYLAGFQRKKFRFDTAIHWLNQCASDGMVSKMFDIIGKDHPVAIPQERIRRYKGDSYDYLLTNKPNEMRDHLIEDFPEDKEGILRFFKAAKKIGKSFNSYGNVFRSEETMSGFGKVRNKMRLLKFALPFIPFLSYSGEKGMQKGLDRFFKSKKLQQIFASDTEMLSCLIPIGWAYYGDFQSPPKGGSQVIPEWLEYVIRYYNNSLNFKCFVKEILLDGDKASGVVFEHSGGTYHVTSKYVIAACDVEALYEKMLPATAVPEKLKTRLKDAELYSSSITLSIALDCPAEALGFNEEMIHLTTEQAKRNEQASGDPEKGEISILAPSYRDKSLAPEGYGTLTLYMPTYMDYHNNWCTHADANGNYVRGDAYKHLKNELAEAIIKRVENALAPSLSAHILFCYTATPITHWRYTGNKNGSIMGAKPNRANMQNKVAHYQTPVANLILGGHWAELGGGVPIAVKAGTNAALLVLKKERSTAFKLLKDYMDKRISADELLSKPAFKYYDNSWEQSPTPAEHYKSIHNKTIDQ